ncbi:MAG TPA: hypothetical protein VFA65_24190 [Bryobacteraceae bacterium]|nr:hypothetical protein [Bryobacteraceae bacterium]
MSETFVEKRGPGRPPLRENSRPSLRDRLRNKTREFATNQNRLELPSSIRERYPDISFEWKAHTVKGEEQVSHLALMRRQGFEPVDMQEVHELYADGAAGPAITDGMLLMARPKELEEKARAETKRLADQQLQDQNRKNGVSRLTPKEFGNFKGNPGGIQEQAMRPIPVEE